MMTYDLAGSWPTWFYPAHALDRDVLPTPHGLEFAEIDIEIAAGPINTVALITPLE